MSSNVHLYIIVEPANGRGAVTVARIKDRALLVKAASSAILEATNKITELAQEDEVLGKLQQEEADRLRRALEMLIPELRLSQVV